MTQRNKRIFRGIILSILLVLLALPYFILQYVIPNNINFLLGKEHSLEFLLPLEAEIQVEEEILYVNENYIEQNDNIEINKPFTVTFNQLGEYKVSLKLFGIIPIKQVSVDVIEPYELIPCGKTIGVEMETDGILVLGLGSVQGDDGKYYEPCRGKLYTGDLIIEANDRLLKDKYDLIDVIENSDGVPIDLKINRSGAYKHVVVEPIKSSSELEYRLGIWVRDNTQGIGTITYINPKTMSYGALGHGITDVDTKELMSLKDGMITNADIISITRGEKGVPGEIEGVILSDDRNVLGDVRVNSNEGIFGKINNKDCELLKQSTMSIALQHEVKEGEAYILTDVAGQGIQDYQVNITKVSNFNNANSKGMVVEITDEKLLNKTNGIVQGMSGSPIIQNGKIIGAVTHVFVQNPSKGYGIYIENMLKKEQLIEN